MRHLSMAMALVIAGCGNNAITSAGAANATIQFYGPACEAVKKAAGQNVEIVFGCPGVIIP